MSYEVPPGAGGVGKGRRLLLSLRWCVCVCAGDVSGLEAAVWRCLPQF